MVFRIHLACGIFIASLLPMMVVRAQDTQTSPFAVGVKDMLEDGDVIATVFSDGAAAHLYGFNGSAGDVVTIAMTQVAGSNLDPFLVLLGPSGEFIASNDDSGTELPLSALINQIQLPLDGTYLIIATSFVYIDHFLVEIGQRADDSETGEGYTLAISGITTPEDLDVATATIRAVSVAIDDRLEGESTAEYPVSYYALEGGAGQEVTIIVESDAFDTILHLFDPNGNRIEVNDDDRSSNTSNSAIRELELPEDGVYLILVTDFFFYHLGKPDTEPVYRGGKYMLRLLRQAGFERACN